MGRMPLPVLRTPRLVLVPFAPEDLDALHALWTDEHVRRYLWDDIVISRERATETFKGARCGAVKLGTPSQLHYQHLGPLRRKHREGAYRRRVAGAAVPRLYPCGVAWPVHLHKTSRYISTAARNCLLSSVRRSTSRVKLSTSDRGRREGIGKCGTWSTLT